MAGYGLLTAQVITDEEFVTFVLQEGGVPGKSSYGDWQIRGEEGFINLERNPLDWPVMQANTQRIQPFVEKLGAFPQTYISVVAGYFITVEGGLEGLRLADIFALHSAKHWDAVLYNLDAPRPGREDDSPIYTPDEFKERVVNSNAYDNDE